MGKSSDAVLIVSPHRTHSRTRPRAPVMQTPRGPLKTHRSCVRRDLRRTRAPRPAQLLWQPGSDLPNALGFASLLQGDAPVTQALSPTCCKLRPPIGMRGTSRGNAHGRSVSKRNRASAIHVGDSGMSCFPVTQEVELNDVSAVDSCVSV